MGDESITVHVAGAGTVRKYMAAEDVELPRGSTVNDLVSLYDIPEEMRVICMIGGTRRTPVTVLKDGDSVAVVPLMAGG